jgi:hypothetical protein
MIATGVASPSAHGQLTTRTEIARFRLNENSAPNTSQVKNVIIAIPITVGTKMPEILSAIFAIGAFVEAASLTIWMIFEIVVSWPMRVALHFMNPD